MGQLEIQRTEVRGDEWMHHEFLPSRSADTLAQRGRAAGRTSDDAQWLSSASRVLSAIPIGLTVLPLWRTGRGWVRMWDFPRSQIVGLGAIALALLHRFGTADDRTLKRLLGASLVYQAFKIWPYTPLHEYQAMPAKDRQPERNVRLMMANVLQSNRNANLMLSAVTHADADVVCLVETDDWWEGEMRSLERTYPWTCKCPLGNTYGMLLYSRLPLRDVNVRFLVRPRVPSFRAKVQLRSGEEIVLYAVHPKPPRPGSPSYGRDAELVMVGREMADDEMPSVVIGDLNDVAWSYTTTLFQRISHTLDPRVGRGMFNTFHARHSLARYPLDHVFHTREFVLTDLQTLGYTGSDHFPLLAELSYRPKRMQDHGRPEMTEADRDVAASIMASGRDRFGRIARSDEGTARRPTSL